MAEGHRATAVARARKIALLSGTHDVATPAAFVATCLREQRYIFKLGNRLDRTVGKTKPIWFGMKVTPEQKRKIKHLAEREGTSAKEAVLRLVDEALAPEKIEVREGSFLSGIEDLIGSVEGPADLSTNPKYLDGFGR